MNFVNKLLNFSLSSRVTRPKFVGPHHRLRPMTPVTSLKAKTDIQNFNTRYVQCILLSRPIQACRYENVNRNSVGITLPGGIIRNHARPREFEDD